MKRIVFILFIATSIFFFAVNTVFAQGAPQDNLALFGKLQEELAGKPKGWQFRVVDENNNNAFVATPYTPEMVLAQEDKARNRPQTFLVEAPDYSTSMKLGITRSITDPNSWAGALFRTMIASGDKNENFFNGDYTLSTTETTEVGKIRSIYNQITSTVTRYDTPQGDAAAYCLTQGAGVCRHMATVLNESLKEAGVKSETVQSPTHVWVRVTLSDPEYKGITFDLDPTWYQQPIPLAPRSKSPLTQEWARRMLAIATAPSGQNNLIGRYISEDMYYIGKQIGNSFAIITEKHGETSLTGTITGNTFNGEKLLVAKECPNLDKYVPATGTISEDGATITSSFINNRYYVDNCIEVPDSEEDDSYTYTKLTETPTPSPTPK